MFTTSKRWAPLPLRIMLGVGFLYHGWPKVFSSQGHEVEVHQVPADVYDTFFPGATEVRETLQYFDECTYFGPERESRIAAAKALYPKGFIGFSDWAKRHLPSTKRAAIPNTSS